MINIMVFSDEKAWSKKINRKKYFFEKICKSFPKKYKFLNKKVSLSLLLSNDKNIKKLNMYFRNKNKPTDVLAFPFNKKLVIKKNIYLGDIVISYDFLNKNKNKDSSSFKERLIKIFIHGFLHLLNFDHKKNRDYKRMFKEEKLIYRTIVSKII